MDSEPTIGQARAAYVIDDNGEVLFDYNGDLELPMASITKVMTAMVALDSGLNLDDPIPFVPVEFPEGAQIAGYKEGDAPTLRELLKATLIYSGNDAAMNVAYAVGGSKEGFADLMNEKAAQLGMTHSHFTNPHGLEEEGHYSSARDLCVMGRYAMEHYPFIRETVHTPSVTIVADGKEVTLESTDELMKSYDGLLGIKTGNTESGTSFLGAAKRDLVTIYSCVLCCETKQGRFDDTRSMLDWAFDLYDQKALARSSWIVAVAPWQDGFWLNCPVTPRRDVNGSVFVEGELATRTLTQPRDALVDPSKPYGAAVWEQNGRLVESVTYENQLSPRASAWNPFVRPLFESGEEPWVG